MTDIIIDGETYDGDSLSDSAKKHVQRIKFTDNEISRAKAQISVFETARLAYVLALKEQVKKSSSPHQEEDKYPDNLSFE